jgi:pyridoxine 5-phosphate synthase
MRIRLGVNVDHVATIRQARRCREPDPVAAAAVAELAGADQITVHLREDRRHILDRDVRILSETVRTRLNLEMGLADDIRSLALQLKPYMVTIVPERREEVTTEGGLDVRGGFERVAGFARQCKDVGIAVSCFIDPEADAIRASKEAGADGVEFHTGPYAHAFDGHQRGRAELDRLIRAAELAHELGLAVYAGHGLDTWNLPALVAEMPHLEEVNIGHHIIARAVFLGLDGAVREVRELLDKHCRGH